MSIYSGTSSILKAYSGSTELDSVYSGSDLVFSSIPDIVFDMEQPPNLGQWASYGVSGSSTPQPAIPYVSSDKIVMSGRTDATGPFIYPTNGYIRTAIVAVRPSVTYNIGVVISSVNTPSSGSAMSWTVRDNGGSSVATGSLNANGTINSNFTSPASGLIRIDLNTAVAGTYIGDTCGYRFRDLKVEIV